MPDDEAGASPPEGDRLALAFGRVLRGAGLEVPIGAVLLFARALLLVGLDRRERVYWAGRATLVKRPEDGATYDRAFAVFWAGAGEAGGDGAPAIGVAARPEMVIALDAGTDEPDEPDEPDEADLAGDADGADSAGAAATAGVRVLEVRWSPTEVLRRRDFAAYTAAEFAEARRLMADLRVAGALRRSRRLRPSRRERGRPDLRRTVRRALQAGGEPIRRAFLSPSEQPRRLVLLLDVSGSMEPYARALVRFLHAAVVSRSRVEAFAIGTRVTRITRELSSVDPDAAVRAAARQVVDWAGGTRLGEGLRAFNETWGLRGLARGAVVVIVSDGWDRGDPELLGEQMGRLHRVAHRIVWANPLKAGPGYAPLARGMAAALPHVDEFVEGHSLAALEHLADVILV